MHNAVNGLMCGCTGCVLSVYNPVLLISLVMAALIFLVVILGIEIAFIWRRCNDRQKRIARRREVISGGRNGGSHGAG